MQIIKKVYAHLLFYLRQMGSSQTPPQGEEGIFQLGHRNYVGGLWEEVGKLQFDFLVSQGLRPEHFLLDIACGSLRAGVHLIPYLDKGHYLGIEKEQRLVELGIEQEVGKWMANYKSPEIVVSRNFDFERLSKTADYAIAQSLFTHLPKEDIALCLHKLRSKIAATGQLFATFFVSEMNTPNPKVAHDHKVFSFSIDEIILLGKMNDWDVEYIGEWSHPRNQKMVKFLPKNRTE